MSASPGQSSSSRSAELDVRLVRPDHEALVEVAVDLLVDRRHDRGRGRGRGSGTRFRRRSRGTRGRRRPRRALPPHARRRETGVADAAGDVALAGCERPARQRFRVPPRTSASGIIPARCGLVQARTASHCEAVARRCFAKCAGSVPDRLERAEAELAVVVEACGVDALHVLLAVLGDERVVRVDRLPAVDDEIPARRLDVAEQLGADEAAAPAKELGPLAVRTVRRARTRPRRVPPRS